jgi:hypothetical protein
VAEGNADGDALATNDLLRKMRGVDVHVIAKRDQARRKDRDETA